MNAPRYGCILLLALSSCHNSDVTADRTSTGSDARPQPTRTNGEVTATVQSRVSDTNTAKTGATEVAVQVPSVGLDRALLWVGDESISVQELVARAVKCATERQQDVADLRNRVTVSINAETNNASITVIYFQGMGRPFWMVTFGRGFHVRTFDSGEAKCAVGSDGMQIPSSRGGDER